jgi:benzoyl-CoA reductase/2-hydroxyglutaryl-CoA dehydratase subunit BcrC/BadD/HgdB
MKAIGIFRTIPVLFPVIQAIREAGLRIVCNDIASLGWYYGYFPDLNASVEQYFVDFYENHIPCPTLLYSADKLMEYMISLLQKTSAEGVIFVGEKFCEYEYFEFPYLEKRLKDKGVPSVLIEIAVDDKDNIASLKNRIEALLEAIDAKRAA